MRWTVVDRDGAETPLDVDVRLVLLAGYTGRDRAAVQAHVEELARHGIAAPTRTPTVYAAPASRVTTGRAIAVNGARTSGEAEFVVIRDAGRLLVGVGSDHTDRELEGHSVVKSKQCCDKPVAATLWPYDDVADHWDDLVLEAEVVTDFGALPYQRGKLADMMTVDTLLAGLARRVGPVDDALVFSGTLPLLTDGFRSGPGFRARLVDPVLDRALVCDYRVDVLPELDT